MSETLLLNRPEDEAKPTHGEQAVEGSATEIPHNIAERIDNRGTVKEGITEADLTAGRTTAGNTIDDVDMLKLANRRIGLEDMTGKGKSERTSDLQEEIAALEKAEKDEKESASDEQISEKESEDDLRIAHAAEEHAKTAALSEEEQAKIIEYAYAKLAQADKDGHALADADSFNDMSDFDLLESQAKVDDRLGALKKLARRELRGLSSMEAVEEYEPLTEIAKLRTRSEGMSGQVAQREEARQAALEEHEAELEDAADAESTELEKEAKRRIDEAVEVPKDNLTQSLRQNERADDELTARIMGQVPGGESVSLSREGEVNQAAPESSSGMASSNDRS